MADGTVARITQEAANPARAVVVVDDEHQRLDAADRAPPALPIDEISMVLLRQPVGVLPQPPG
jgi:hypothetical protein